MLCLVITVSVQADEKTLTNAEVVKLVKLGIGDDVVLAKIRQAPTVDFKLETDDLGSLKAAGVSGKVIAAMLDRSSGDAGAGAGAMTPASMPVIAGRPGAESAGQATLQGKDGRRPLKLHVGEFHKTGLGPIGNLFVVYSGAKCAIRTTDRRPALTIRRDTSPVEQILLVKLDVTLKDNDRSLKIGSLLKGGNPFSDKKDAKVDPDWTVAYGANEGPTGVWTITPNYDLPPGEYGLYLKQSALLDFGVD
jgi:hypothetical protein